mmetsp:Transcript_76766/g.167749  ORF Transcript_76766/g.167749 Transcript_76766/m.167749 type:complete len:112 (-) Transcript_76766:98-433(-)
MGTNAASPTVKESSRPTAARTERNLSPVQPYHKAMIRSSGSNSSSSSSKSLCHSNSQGRKITRRCLNTGENLVKLTCQRSPMKCSINNNNNNNINNCRNRCSSRRNSNTDS